MNRVEKRLYGYVDLDRDENGKMVICLTYNDCFAWATSWGVGIFSDFDKPIKAYKHFLKYLIDNNIDYWDAFYNIEVPDRKTQENMTRYFKLNQSVFNQLINSLKDYNDFTRTNLENEKFNLGSEV